MEANLNKTASRKLALFMHISIDGFTARPNGSMDWIHINEDMFEYARLQTEESDTAIYGRKTFELMDAYWPTAADKQNASKHDIEHSTWYSKVQKIVVSETMRGKKIPQVEIISENVITQIKALKQRAGKDIVMFGSPTLSHAFMNHNLIDDYWLFINPVILGTGIPLFKDIKNQLNLELIKNISLAGGVIAAHYKNIPG
jgi:dihydrofolate reductase